ncbi:NAD(P)-binding protein [Hymenopellis radicata]|nr:NAD(P)-binding protein [Hymenopellis radicata]
MSPVSESSNHDKRVLVTAGSGFIAHHIVLQLLEQGYFVRATARGTKKYDPSSFEVSDVPDIACADFSEILKDIRYIIHTAAPVPGRADFETALRTGVQGSLNVLVQGYKAGIRKVVVTTSMAAFPFNGPFGVNDFHPITKEEAAAGGEWGAYVAEKTFADKAILEFKRAHPDLDVTTLAPNWVYGPLAPGFEHIIPEPNYSAISTDGYIYGLLDKNVGNFPPTAGYVDVRDTARAHVLALTSRPSSEVGDKRYSLCSPHPWVWKDVLAYLAKERPELEHRLFDADKAPDLPPFLESEVFRDVLEEVVGLKVDSYVPWQSTMLDTVDRLVEVENAWKAKGYDVRVPSAPPVQF